MLDRACAVGSEDLCGEGDGVGVDSRVRVDVVVGRDAATVVGGLEDETPVSPVARDAAGEAGQAGTALTAI